MILGLETNVAVSQLVERILEVQERSLSEREKMASPRRFAPSDTGIVVVAPL